MGQDVANFQMTEMAKTEEHMSEVMQQQSNIQQQASGKKLAPPRSMDDAVTQAARENSNSLSFQMPTGASTATVPMLTRIKRDPMKWAMLALIAVLLLQNVGLEVKLGGRSGGTSSEPREQKPLVVPQISRGYSSQIPHRIPGALGGGRGLALGHNQGQGLALLARGDGLEYQRAGQNSAMAMVGTQRKGRTPTIVVMDEDGYDETDLLFGDQSQSFRA
jgi:hypothetical protein